MYKSCGRCGKIHDTNYKCNVGKVYKKNNIDRLRNTYDWLLKTEEIKKASQYLCAICKEEGRYTYNNLEVHHITKLHLAPERVLDNYNLLCLCVKHHKMCDRDEYSKEYQYELAKKREEGC